MTGQLIAFVLKGSIFADTSAPEKVVESGDYDVQVDGVKVCAYAKGGAFGELELMHNMPRAATIECVTKEVCENKLWEITRQKFRYALTKSHLNDALEAETYRNKKGTVIFAEGEAGNKFYVVKKKQRAKR